MRFYHKILFIALALPLYSQNVKYGGEFLATGVGARALSMGSAFTAVAGDITSVYWNPAGIGAVQGWQGHIMHSERFSGMVNWDFITFGGSVRPDFSIAVSYYRLGVDGIPLTRLQNSGLPIGTIYTNEAGETVINDPYVYKRIDNIDNALTFSFAKKFSSSLTIGITTKVIHNVIGSESAWGLGFDAGLYWEPLGALKTGLIMRDVTSTFIAWKGRNRDIIPPSVTFGAAYSYPYGKFTILPSADCSINFENRHLDSQISVGQTGLELAGGCEITYDAKLAFRCGIHRSALTVGAGFRFSFLTVDYGFTPHNELGNTHRISVSAQILP